MILIVALSLACLPRTLRYQWHLRKIDDLNDMIYYFQKKKLSRSSQMTNQKQGFSLWWFRMCSSGTIYSSSSQHRLPGSQICIWECCSPSSLWKTHVPLRPWPIALRHCPFYRWRKKAIAGWKSYCPFTGNKLRYAGVPSVNTLPPPTTPDNSQPPTLNCSPCSSC